ncbi:DUF6455 family protein [Ancylobacter sp.]|uniref:DUF6455 family protein n=1 Tax=Ancylobacter sp. TaxID=1872567 RepID=UPI003D0BC9C2
MNVDTIDERLALFRAMAEQAGVDLATLSAQAPQELRAAAQRCLGCRDAPDCHRWLEARDATAPVPGFCRNAGQFDVWREETAAQQEAAAEQGAGQAMRRAAAE